MKEKKSWSVKKILLVSLLVGFILGISFIIGVFLKEMNYYNATFANHIHNSNEWCWECNVIEKYGGSAFNYALNTDMIKFLSLPIVAIFIVATELILGSILLFIRRSREIIETISIEKNEEEKYIKNILD